MILLPHHDGSALYVQEQAPEPGATIRIRLRAPLSFGPLKSVHVRSLRDGEPHFDAAARLGCSDGWVWWEAALTLVNPVTKYRFLLEREPNGDTAARTESPGAGELGRDDPTVRYCWLNAEALFDRDIPDAQDFRIVTYEPAPQWVRRSVVYQIFPDRFARSPLAAGREVPQWGIECDWDRAPVIGSGPETPYQFFGGDLDGIIGKLKHIADLGADVVYLTPFFPARSNHRYDASTFSRVDDLLGGDDALIRLVEAAHSNGLKVIGDLTTNHTGDDHEWFRRAQQDPDAVERGYYYFRDEGDGYAAWLGVRTLPKLNWASDYLMEEFVSGPDSVVGRWLEEPYNLDGWRIDVANMTGRHGQDDYNQEVAAAVRSRMLEANPDTMLLAESTNDAAGDFSGQSWQSAMTYAHFTRPLWCWLAKEDAGVNFFGAPHPGPPRLPAEQFQAAHASFSAAYSWRAQQQNLLALNTHDTARAASVMIAGGQLIGAAMMFTLPGIPMIFAGDEFGLLGTNGEESRTPMPWHDDGRIVTDLRTEYARLSGLRRAHQALTAGSLRWLYAEGDVLAYIRELAIERVFVLVSRTGFGPVELPGLGAEVAGTAAAYSTGGTHVELSPDGSLQISGEAAGAHIWVLPGVDAPGRD